MKKIERPNMDIIGWTNTATRWDKFQEWFDEHVEPINKMLAEGVAMQARLGNHGDDPMGSENKIWYCSTNSTYMDTHKALLINIQPIKKETTRDLVIAFLAILGDNIGDDIARLNGLRVRARKSLEAE